MPEHSKDPKYLHPILRLNLNTILQHIKNQLPNGWSCILNSGLRTSAEQFELFKRGRAFQNGSWVTVGAVVTQLDGINKLSKHNYLPAYAMDLWILDQNGDPPWTSPYFDAISNTAQAFNLRWGGNWRNFIDKPHVYVKNTSLFKNSYYRDYALLWQLYLAQAQKYTAALDGLFGPKSKAALIQETNQSERNIVAWDFLVNNYGQVEKLEILNSVDFLPSYLRFTD